MKRLLFSIGILLALNGCISDDYIDNSDKNIDVIAKTLVNEESFDQQQMANSLYEKLNNSFSHNQTRALANTVYPVYYGGSYINKNNKLVVYIAGPITKGTNELFQKLDPNEIIVEACDYSYQELHKVMDVIDEYKLNHSNGDPIADNFNIWCIRDSLNRVIVELEECNDARIEEFKKNVVDAPSIIFKQSRGKVQLHSYLDAGQMMNSPQGSFSNGYRAQQYGVNGIITSGHAVRQNDFVYMNGELVGVAQNTQQWGTIDAAFVTSNSNITTTNYIAGTRNVLSTIISEPGENTIINKCGFRTGITSGKVVSTRASVTSFGHTITNVTSATYDSEQGDSGGVVYSYISSTNTRYTVGVHLGSDGTYAYYSKANEINYAFNTNRF